jgi:hypothetical protein
VNGTGSPSDQSREERKLTRKSSEPWFDVWAKDVYDVFWRAMVLGAPAHLWIVETMASAPERTAAIVAYPMTVAVAGTLKHGWLALGDWPGGSLRGHLLQAGAYTSALLGGAAGARVVDPLFSTPGVLLWGAVWPVVVMLTLLVVADLLDA